MGHARGTQDTGASAAWRVDGKTAEAVLAARFQDPFAVLGPHETPEGAAIRAFVPHAQSLSAIPEDPSAEIPLTPRGGGFFEGLAAGRNGRFRYRLRAANAGGTWQLIDPYALAPVLGPTDDYLLVEEGTHRLLYERLGAHPMRFDGYDGVHFAVWAPQSRKVPVASSRTCPSSTGVSAKTNLSRWGFAGDDSRGAAGNFDDIGVWINRSIYPTREF
jgi:1,4-alpha-glucan branching enzyme